jgi:hypothetical protein
LFCIFSNSLTTTHEERSIERGQFEDRYCAALAKINDIIDMKNAPAPPINTAPSVVGNQQNNASRVFSIKSTCVESENLRR